jgi:hypothetical protein
MRITMIWKIFAFPCLLAAQEATPVALSYPEHGFAADSNGSPYVTIEIENRSSKTITAAGLQVLLKNPQGAVVHNSTFWTANSLAPVAGAPAFLPGARRTQRLMLPRLEQNPKLEGMHLEVRADYVRFADGTDWGPDRTKSSLYFKGFESGARFQRDHLRQVLKTGGEAALKEYLEQNR